MVGIRPGVEEHPRAGTADVVRLDLWPGLRSRPGVAVAEADAAPLLHRRAQPVRDGVERCGHRRPQRGRQLLRDPLDEVVPLQVEAARLQEGTGDEQGARDLLDEHGTAPEVVEHLGGVEAA